MARAHWHWHWHCMHARTATGRERALGWKLASPDRLAHRPTRIRRTAVWFLPSLVLGAVVELSLSESVWPPVPACPLPAAPVHVRITHSARTPAFRGKKAPPCPYLPACTTTIDRSLCLGVAGAITTTSVQQAIRSTFRMKNKLLLLLPTLAAMLF